MTDGAQAVATNGDPMRVTFSELVHAHQDWAKRVYGRRAGDSDEEEQLRDVFYEKLRSFESDGGRLVDAYWCRGEDSAVALTAHPVASRGRLARLLAEPQEEQLRLHRVSDWITAPAAPVADLLHSCDILAVKANQGNLAPTHRAVVMQWLYAVESHLLGFLERMRLNPKLASELPAFTRRERAELRKIERYLIEAGEKRARLTYTLGMIVGGTIVLVAFALLAALAFWIFDVIGNDDMVQRFYAAAFAGGAGAIVSVLMRMSGRGSAFSIDPELGRWGVALLGSFRPLVGAVSGVILALLLQTPLIPLEGDTEDSFALVVVVAFLAGFSERWTKIVLGGAMTVIGGQADDEEATPAVPPPTDAEASSDGTDVPIAADEADPAFEPPARAT